MAPGVDSPQECCNHCLCHDNRHKNLWPCLTEGNIGHAPVNASMKYAGKTCDCVSMPED